MKFLIIIGSLILIFPIIISGQTTTPSPVYNGKAMVALYNLYPEHEDCSPKKYVGIITKVDGNYPDMNLTLNTKSGKETMGFSTGELSNADIGNLFYWLVVKGKTIQIIAYMCGSGGFLWIDNFKSVPVVIKKKK